MSVLNLCSKCIIFIHIPETSRQANKWAIDAHKKYDKSSYCIFKKAEHLLPFDVIVINVDFSFVHTNKSQKKSFSVLHIDRVGE